MGVGVGECQSEDPFICFGAKPIQRACAEDISRDWKMTREGKVPGQNGRGQSAEESSQEKRAEAKVCGLRGRVGQRERMSQRS